MHSDVGFECIFNSDFIEDNAIIRKRCFIEFIRKSQFKTQLVIRTNKNSSPDIVRHNVRNLVFSKNNFCCYNNFFNIKIFNQIITKIDFEQLSNRIAIELMSKNNLEIEFLEEAGFNQLRFILNETMAG